MNSDEFRLFADALNAPHAIREFTLLNNGALVWGGLKNPYSVTQVIRIWITEIGVYKTKEMLCGWENEQYKDEIAVLIDKEYQNGIKGGWYG